MKKYLYLLKQRKFDSFGTYDSAVVCATTPEKALQTHPCIWQPFLVWSENKQKWYDFEGYEEDWGEWVANDWPAPDKITCTLLGVAQDDIEIGVVISSFNAG